MKHHGLNKTPLTDAELNAAVAKAIGNADPGFRPAERPVDAASAVEAMFGAGTKADVVYSIDAQYGAGWNASVTPIAWNIYETTAERALSRLVLIQDYIRSTERKQPVNSAVEPEEIHVTAHYAEPEDFKEIQAIIDGGEFVAVPEETQE